MQDLGGVTSFTFAYPTRMVGGGEYFFIRLAIHLSQLGYQVNIIDYEDGFIAKEVRGYPYITHLPFHEGQVSIPQHTLLMMPPLLHVAVSHWQVPSNSKVILMCWDKLQFFLRFGPLDFTPPLNFKKLRDEAIALNKPKFEAFQEAVQTMAAHGGVMFLEPYAQQAAEVVFDAHFSPEYAWMAPTPCSPTHLPALLNRWNRCHESNRLHLGYLGRLSFEKAACILYLLKHAGRIATTEYPISVHIIGEGDHKSLIEQWILEQQFTNALDIRWAGTLTGDALEYYMKSTLDACFAMGTSLLESAKIKIPSIIIDSSLNLIPAGTKLAYLHESDFGLLGEFSNSTITPRNHTFDEVIADIRQNKADIGQKDYDYWYNHHRVEHTAEKIIQLTKMCTYTGDVYNNCNTYLPQEGRLKQPLGS